MTQKGRKEYVQMKESPRNESFADGSVGARDRMMVRGGCLPVRGSERMTWKYDDCRCGYRDMCYLNALYMKKKEQGGEGL